MTNISFPANLANPGKRFILEAVVQRDFHTCQMCGSAEGDCCLHDRLPTSLHVIAILPFRLGGRFVEDNLRTVCLTCASGMQAIENRSLKSGAMEVPERLGRIQLLTQVRRAMVDDQKAVAKWLFNKFKPHIPFDE